MSKSWNYAYSLSLENIRLEKAKKNGLKKVVIKFPNNGTFLDTYAWILFQLKNSEASKKYMDLAFYKHETEPSGGYVEHYGDILYQLGNKYEAISFLKKADSTMKVKHLSRKIKRQITMNRFLGDLYFLLCGLRSSCSKK